MPRTLFLDMNSFFASVEQQENPALQGCPVIVAPVMTSTTSAIAASYEARPYGIKTGISVREARKLCPHIAVVSARPQLYLQYHQRIINVLQQYFVQPRALSIDEMACTISRLHSTLYHEEKLAVCIKTDIQAQTGLLCSVGTGPNIFLAKVASERQKPNGLTLFHNGNLPEALFALELCDLPGIADKMIQRLQKHGITTVRELWEADDMRLKRAWGSVTGARWYWMLRGSTEADYGSALTSPRRSLGRSHVLPPQFRTREGAAQIALRLAEKALQALREIAMRASSVEICIGYKHQQDGTGYVWKRKCRRHIHASDSPSWIHVLLNLLRTLPATRFQYTPWQASVTFSGLLAVQNCNLSLFEEDEAIEKLSTVTDLLLAKGSTVLPGSMFWNREQAPLRISFGPPHFPKCAE